MLPYPVQAARTRRKKNATLILVTQSAIDVTRTQGASAPPKSIPTKLLLANRQLTDEAGAHARRAGGLGRQ